MADRWNLESSEWITDVTGFNQMTNGPHFNPIWSTTWDPHMHLNFQMFLLLFSTYSSFKGSLFAIQKSRKDLHDLTKDAKSYFTSQFSATAALKQGLCPSLISFFQTCVYKPNMFWCGTKQSSQIHPEELVSGHPTLNLEVCLHTESYHSSNQKKFLLDPLHFNEVVSIKVAKGYHHIYLCSYITGLKTHHSTTG